MLLSRNKNYNVYPCKPQFYYKKVGFNGVKIIQACFRDTVLGNLKDGLNNGMLLYIYYCN